MICSWRSHRWCSQGQLESLIGHLQHAKVVWPGCTFLRHMIDLLCCFCQRDHSIRMSAEFHLHLLWWNEFFVKFEQSIAYKELFPVVIAAHVWGLQWFRQHILFRPDNEAVNMLNSWMSKVSSLMFLLRKLLFHAAQSNFTFTTQHVPGIHNAVADALSRFHWQEFRCLAPEAHPVPVDIPQSLLEDLIHPLSRGSGTSS